MGYFSNKQVEHELQQLIEDKDPQVQSYAAYALGHLRKQKYTPLLIQKLKHPQSIVRQGAANGLRLMGSAIAKQPLIEALHDDDPEVQKSVLEALGTIGGEELEIYLIKLINNIDCSTTIDTAVFVLGIAKGEPTVELLAKMLQKFFAATTREEYIKIADPEIIIKALETIGNASAIEVLLGILSNDSYLNSFALNALTRIGGLYIIPRLREIQLKSEDSLIFDAIATIQKSYRHYNPKYCEMTLLSIHSDDIQKSRNNWKYLTQYHYSYLSNYYENRY